MVSESVRTVLAQSAHSLIGELWFEAMSLGYTKLDAKNRTRLLWLFWDGHVPVPNPHTAPFWYFVCEAATNLFENAENRDFTFVPPLSMPLQYENIPDTGIDSFLTPRTPRLAERQYHRVKTNHRADMLRLRAFDAATPIAHARFGQLVVRTRPIGVSDSTPAAQCEQAWRVRREMGHYIATLPKLPTCPGRIFGPAGQHIKDWTYYGLALRGKFDGYDTEWARGTQVAVGEPGALWTRLPMFTLPFWLGFRLGGGPNRHFFNWCEEYVKHRPGAIEALKHSDSYVGYPDFTDRLSEAGFLVNTTGKSKRLSSRESQFQLMSDALANLKEL